MPNLLERRGHEDSPRRQGFDTEAWPDCTGTVIRLDGHLAQIKLDGGGEAWLPRTTLITATA